MDVIRDPNVLDNLDPATAAIVNSLALEKLDDMIGQGQAEEWCQKMR